MTWFRVDDGFYDHPKIAHLNMAARGLWVTCGSYCGKHLTDGHIARNQIRRLGGTPAQIRNLIESGVWFECDLHPNCVAFHDWIEQQPTRESIINRRADDAKRKHEAREAKRAEQQRQRNVRTGLRTDTSEGVRTESALPDPTRPDPKRTNSPNAAGLRNVDHAAAAAETTFSDGTPIPEAPDAEEHPPTRGSLALVPQPRRDVTSTAATAATAVRLHIPATIPATVRDALAAEVTRLARDPGVERADIDTALDVWATRPAAGPKLLPHLVADAARARQARAAPTVTKATQRAQATLAAGEALIAKLHQQEQP